MRLGNTRSNLINQGCHPSQMEISSENATLTLADFLTWIFLPCIIRGYATHEITQYEPFYFRNFKSLAQGSVQQENVRCWVGCIQYMSRGPHARNSGKDRVFNPLSKHFRLETMKASLSNRFSKILGGGKGYKWSCFSKITVFRGNPKV